MGGRFPSATTTLRPLRLAAIAAASPAGPPPITNTSVSNIQNSPTKQHKLGTETRTSGSENAPRPRSRPLVRHELLEHTEHGSGRQIASPPQTLPRRLQRLRADPQRILCSLKHLGTTRVKNPRAYIVTA